MGSRVFERVWNIFGLIIAIKSEVVRKEPVPVSLLAKQIPNEML